MGRHPSRHVSSICAGGLDIRWLARNEIMMAVLEHLNSLFGHGFPAMLEHSLPAVFLWNDTEGRRIVSTVGMSCRPQTVPKGMSCPSAEPRTELMAYCHVSDAEVIAGLLLDLAEYPFLQHAHLFWYQVLPLARPLADESQIEGVLLSFPPLEADQATFRID